MLPLGGVGHRHADHENEGGLDHVPQTGARPCHVAEVVLHYRPGAGVWIGAGDRVHPIVVGGFETE